MNKVLALVVAAVMGLSAAAFAAENEPNAAPVGTTPSAVDNGGMKNVQDSAKKAPKKKHHSKKKADKKEPQKEISKPMLNN